MLGLNSRITKKGKYHIKSFLDGDALTIDELLAWENKIKIRSKGKCRFRQAKSKQILKYMDEQESLAFFDATKIPPIIYYRERATEYVISHEFYHLDEFMEIGKKEFLKGVERYFRRNFD